MELPGADHRVDVVPEQILQREILEKHWVGLVEEKIKQREGRDQATTNACIFQVPPSVRRVKPEDFGSALFRLGLYHAKKPESKFSEGDEWKFCVAGLLESGEFEFLVELIKKKEEEVRSFYQGELGIQTSPCLAVSLALDACFIAAVCVLSSCSTDSDIELLKDFVFQGFQGFTFPHYSDAIRDIFLLENQIPLFLLGDAVRCLWKSSGLPQNPNLVVPPICFRNLCLFDGEAGHGGCCLQGTEKVEPQRHLLCCLYEVYARQEDGSSSSTAWKQNKRPSPTIWERIPTASYLRRHGVRFKGVSKNCNGIKFDWITGRLHLPVMIIDNSTEAVLKNLIAYEEHFKRESDLLGCYVAFMDSLIVTEKDMEELMK